MKSKTKIKNQTRKKTNPDLVETINEAKQNKSWMKIAERLSGPTRKMPSVNLEDLDKNSKEGDTLVIPGKILGSGNLNKKLKIVAFSFSQSALKKLKNKKCEALSIRQEIKINPKAEGIKILQ